MYAKITIHSPLTNLSEVWKISNNYLQKKVTNQNHIQEVINSILIQ
jgi:hypothetical protein